MCIMILLKKFFKIKICHNIGLQNSFYLGTPLGIVLYRACHQETFDNVPTTAKVKVKSFNPVRLFERNPMDCSLSELLLP